MPIFHSEIKENGRKFSDSKWRTCLYLESKGIKYNFLGWCEFKCKFKDNCPQAIQLTDEEIGNTYLDLVYPNGKKQSNYSEFNKKSIVTCNVCGETKFPRDSIKKDRDLKFKDGDFDLIKVTNGKYWGKAQGNAYSECFLHLMKEHGILSCDSNFFPNFALRDRARHRAPGMIGSKE